MKEIFSVMFYDSSLCSNNRISRFWKIALRHKFTPISNECHIIAPQSGKLSEVKHQKANKIIQLNEEIIKGELTKRARITRKSGEVRRLDNDKPRQRLSRESCEFAKTGI